MQEPKAHGSVHPSKFQAQPWRKSIRKQREATLTQQQPRPLQTLLVLEFLALIGSLLHFQSSFTVSDQGTRHTHRYTKLGAADGECDTAAQFPLPAALI